MKNKDLIKKIEDVGLIQKQQFIFIAFLILLGMFTPINSTHILMLIVRLFMVNGLWITWIVFLYCNKIEYL